MKRMVTQAIYDETKYLIRKFPNATRNPNCVRWFSRCAASITESITASAGRRLSRNIS